MDMSTDNVQNYMRKYIQIGMNLVRHIEYNKYDNDIKYIILFYFDSIMLGVADIDVINTNSKQYCQHIKLVFRHFDTRLILLFDNI
jgi:hypothetical protein